MSHKSNGRVRSIKKIWKSRPTIEGAGVHLKRAFGFHEVGELDPFLLLDAFGSENPEDYKRGFPWHPHRGIETITYLLDGHVEHGDSMGHRDVIKPGDVQWMTAGSGIIHQEMPKGDSRGHMWGFQLWANLPAKQKMMNPRYRSVLEASIPLIKTKDSASIRVIAGEIEGTRGPVGEIIIEPEFLDVSLPSSKRFTHLIPSGHTAIAYVFEGEAYFDENRDAFGREEIGINYFDMARPCICKADSLILFGPGDHLMVTTENKPVRFLFIAGKPIKEPIAWYGPIVMNTQEELRQAFDEYNAGVFVKDWGDKLPNSKAPPLQRTQE